MSDFDRKPEESLANQASMREGGAVEPASTWRTVPAPRSKRRFPWVPVLLAFVFGVVLVSGVVMWIGNAQFFAAKEPGEQETNLSQAPQATEEPTSMPVVYPNHIADIVDKAGPAVVKIDTKVTTEQSQPLNPFFNDPFFRQFFGDTGPGQQRVQEGMGSGFIISEDGYILTNQHVVSGASEILVTVVGYEEPFKAQLVGEDFDLDLAVIKIKAPKPLPTLKMGDSDKVKVGEWVIAIGNPYGLDHTVTVGVVSAKGRPVNIPTEQGMRRYKNLMQTDTAINPGNSGGPLLNLNGEVIGINTAINANAQGIGFVIPTSTIRPVLDELIEKGKVIRPFLGVTVQDVTQELAEYFNLKEAAGAIVTDVVPGSPADQAGLRRGDVILSIDERPVKNAEDLVNQIQSKKVGAKSVLLLSREGQTMYVQVTIREK
jgi:Do/DeqQ family serine protease